MELHDTPMVRYLDQSDHPDAVPTTDPVHWFLQHRDDGWQLPVTLPAQSSQEFRAAPPRLRQPCLQSGAG